MCLNLLGSKYESIEEVEYLLNNDFKKFTEPQIIEMKDSRKQIKESLKLIKQYSEIIQMGI